MEDTLLLEVSILLFLLVVLRLFYLVHKIVTGNTACTATKRTSPAKTIVCIGSGGHTTEMLQLLRQLNSTCYSPRYYIIAKSDTTSLPKIQEAESELEGGVYETIFIPRSRVVGQSYVTSVLTTLYATAYSIPILVRIRPDLLLCNGPGTCIPICVLAFILKAVFFCDTRIVFVESFCRTKTFSLTGKILLYIADNIIVQWPQLQLKMRRATYLGQLL